MITYDDFKKVEIRAGKIVSAEKIPDTDKLLKLMVDFGEFEEIEKNATDNQEKEIIEDVQKQKVAKLRQIVSGIALYFPDPNELTGKVCMFVTNLEPREIKGYISNGMLFAISTTEGKFSLLEPKGDIPPGTLAK